MKITNKISVIKGDEKHTIDFGIAETEKEKRDMFKLRYKIYVEKKKYIPKELTDGELEVDSYDKSDKCVHFIAKNNDQVIGCLRIIRTTPLPIFKDYFEFEEPNEFKNIPPEQKFEVGRLISIGNINNKFLPRHLIPLGLLYSLAKFTHEENMVMGYGAIKKYIFDKFAKIKFPVHKIENYKNIYNPESDDPLKNFFNKKDNPVIPVYFIRKETSRYLDKLFKKSFAFKEKEKDHFLFRGDYLMLISMLAKKLGF